MFFPTPVTACRVARISTLGMNPNIGVYGLYSLSSRKNKPSEMQRIASENMRVAIGECSAVKAGDLIFVSGHVGMDANGEALLKCGQLGRGSPAKIQRKCRW